MCGLLENFCSPYMKLLLPNQNTYLINENMQVKHVVSGINSHCFISQNVDCRLVLLRSCTANFYMCGYYFSVLQLFDPKENESYYKSDEKLILILDRGHGNK